MPTKQKNAPTDQRPTCSVCGGHNVEDTAWISYRPDGTAEIVNGEGPLGDDFGYWCHDCQEHNGLDFPTTTPADDAHRQAAAAARAHGPELLDALAALVRAAERMAASTKAGTVTRAAMIRAEHLVNRCRQN